MLVVVFQRFDILHSWNHVQVTASSNSYSQSERVVITGQGVVSSLGQDVETFYNNLLEVCSYPETEEIADPAQRFAQSR